MNFLENDIVVCDKIIKPPRDKRVTEIDYQQKYAIYSTACSIVYKYWTPITNHQTSVFRDILGSFGYETQNLQKKTDFINVMFHF